MQPTPITIITSLFFAISVSANAIAADPVPEEQLIPPNPDPLVDTSEWGGLYLGVYSGYSWFSSDGASTSEVDGHGEKLGGFVGYNWQFENKIVTGLEALGGYSGVQETASNTTIDQEWDASLRARLGYAFDQSVLYSFAGYAVTSLEAQTLTGTDDQTLQGFTLGLGWETQLSDKILGRIEYGFSSYADESFSIGNPTSNAIDFKEQSINVGIGFKY
ncbi:MAG: outer membrane beta-barrel protein [Pseudomonadota bacterium]